MKVVDYILARLREPSTWRGLTALATTLGIALEPSQIEAIGVAGLAVIGLIDVFKKDKPADTSAAKT